MNAIKPGRIAAFFCLFWALLATHGAIAGPKVIELKLAAAPGDAIVVGGILYLRQNPGTPWQTPVLRGDRLVLIPETPDLPANKDETRLPDGALSLGKRDIAAAWLTRPTGRYDHGVLGDAIEAGGVAVRMKNGQRLEYVLPLDSVFEDRLARLADLDGDGKDEVITVRSYLDAGAALAVFKPAGGKLTLLAGAQPIGLSHRWLNPLGVADFDGDGNPEIAAVITPHIGGQLTLFELQDGKLVATASASAFSNHAMGSRQLHLAAFGDFLGDGRIVIALPDAWRGALRLLSFANSRTADLGTFRHGAGISGPVVAQDLDGDGRPEVVYLLEDGRLMALKF